MFFVVSAWDKPDRSEARKRTKPSHKAHLDRGALSVRVLQSGPLLTEAGVEQGSLIVVEAPDPSSVRAFVQEDPYVAAGIFESWSVHRWHWVRGNPLLAATPGMDMAEGSGPASADHTAGAAFAPR